MDHANPCQVDWPNRSCAGRARDAPARGGSSNLEDAITDLYGGDGITLAPAVPSHEAHFTPTGLSELAQLQDSIRSSLVAFAPAPPVSSFTFDLEQGVFTRSTQTFGPLVSERAPTIGRLKVNVGASYTEAIYSQFEGTDLDNVELQFAHIDCCFGPGLSGFEQDQVGVNIDLEIEQRVAALRATLGLTDHWDIGLLVPYVWNRLEADAVGFVIDNSGSGSIASTRRPGGILRSPAPAAVPRESATSLPAPSITWWTRPRWERCPRTCPICRCSRDSLPVGPRRRPARFG